MEQIETDRLILREWLPEDVAPFIALNKDPRVMEWMPKLLTAEESIAFVDKIRARFEKQGFGMFACVIKDTGEFIGFVGLNVPEFEAHFTPCVEIGWRLAYHAWGKGYASEAARAVLQVGFEKYVLKEIVAFTVPANVRS